MKFAKYPFIPIVNCFFKSWAEPGVQYTAISLYLIPKVSDVTIGCLSIKEE